jgi:hypothetical protein
MKYTTEIEINKPIEQVVALFDEPANMKHWMEGLLGIEYLSGVPGQPGAKARLKFKVRSRSFDMVETITGRDLPKSFSAKYETGSVINIVCNKFEPITENKTKYISENELQFSGFAKLLGFLMPGAFKKQSYQYQLSFKNFVERQS